MGVGSAWRSSAHSVPDTDRSTYFSEKLLTGWYELLCCPSSMGCRVLHFQPSDKTGGEAQYKVKLRLSHSEHVPRYQLHVVHEGSTKQWIVGHMEKTETHLRAKYGELIRVQVWKLTCNSMVFERPHSSLKRKSYCVGGPPLRAMPSATDMLTMGMTIATQAKVDHAGTTTERWVQTVGVDNKGYKLMVEPPKTDCTASSKRDHRNLKSMNVLRILHKGKKVAIARKQRFAGALGKVEQPYLGVQVKPSDRHPEEADEADDAGIFQSMLDTKGLMLLLMCLAWSEETMSPRHDMIDRYAKAMHVAQGHGSPEDIGLSVDWTTNDIALRMNHIQYAEIHTWDTDDDARAEYSDPDVAMLPEAPEVFGVRTAANSAAGGTS